MRPGPNHARGRRVALLVVALAVGASRAPDAWAQAIGQGFELERGGHWDQAASLYFAVLRAEPANVSALLGLERVLPPLNRLAELLPVALRAARASPHHAALRSILLRTYVGLNELDSARAVALAWAGEAPRDEAPYREWASALDDARRHDAARDALVLGRRALGRPGAFGLELAELAERRGDWEGAAREWAAALGDAPAQLPNATSELAETPAALRERVARLLIAGDPPPLTRRLAAALLLTWGEPRRAWVVFAPSVAAGGPDAGFALRHFADLAAAQRSPEASEVRGLALERFAELTTEPTAARARADAARAFTAAGDRDGARRVLERIAGDTSAPADAQALGQRAVIEALIASGQLAEASARLAQNTHLETDDRAALGLELGRAMMLSGDLDRAAAVVGRDSSVDALALRGWIALYRGWLAEAVGLFRSAGAYAGDRRDATERTTMVALVEQLGRDTFPELGHALLLLARKDSAGALAALQRGADELPRSASGRADLLLLAGRIAERLGVAERDVALRVFAEIVRSGGAGAAPPAAQLEWARMLLAEQQSTAAMEHLEHLILTYPTSAVVPEARQELERAKGAIPKS